MTTRPSRQPNPSSPTPSTSNPPTPPPSGSTKSGSTEATPPGNRPRHGGQQRSFNDILRDIRQLHSQGRSQDDCLELRQLNNQLGQILQQAFERYFRDWGEDRVQDALRVAWEVLMRTDEEGRFVYDDQNGSMSFLLTRAEWEDEGWQDKRGITVGSTASRRAHDIPHFKSQCFQHRGYWPKPDEVNLHMNHYLHAKRQLRDEGASTAASRVWDRMEKLASNPETVAGSDESHEGDSAGTTHRVATIEEAGFCADAMARVASIDRPADADEDAPASTEHSALHYDDPAFATMTNSTEHADDLYHAARETLGQEKARGFLLLSLLRFSVTWDNRSTTEWVDVAALAGDPAEGERAYAALRRAAPEWLERIDAPTRWAEAQELFAGWTFTAAALRQRYSRYRRAVMEQVDAEA